MHQFAASNKSNPCKGEFAVLRSNFSEMNAPLTKYHQGWRCQCIMASVVMKRDSEDGGKLDSPDPKPFASCSSWDVREANMHNKFIHSIFLECDGFICCQWLPLPETSSFSFHWGDGSCRIKFVWKECGKDNWLYRLLLKIGKWDWRRSCR